LTPPAEAAAFYTDDRMGILFGEMRQLDYSSVLSLRNDTFNTTTSMIEIEVMPGIAGGKCHDP
jgi:hypothetical protein